MGPGRGSPPAILGPRGGPGGAKGAPGRKPPSGLGLLALCCTRRPRLNRDLNDLDGRGSQKDTAFAVNVTFKRAPHDATPARGSRAPGVRGVLAYSRAPGGGLDWIRIHPRPPLHGPH